MSVKELASIAELIFYILRIFCVEKVAGLTIICAVNVTSIYIVGMCDSHMSPAIGFFFILFILCLQHRMHWSNNFVLFLEIGSLLNAATCSQRTSIIYTAHKQIGNWLLILKTLLGWTCLFCFLCAKNVPWIIKKVSITFLFFNVHCWLCLQCLYTSTLQIKHCPFFCQNCLYAQCLSFFFFFFKGMVYV